jgi:hypothetical protein
MSNSRLVLLVLLCGFVASQLSGAQEEKKELEHWIGVLKTAKEAERRVEAIEEIKNIAAVRVTLAKPAIPAVIAALKDQDENVRKAAAAVLPLLNPEPMAAVSGLVGLLTANEEKAVKQAALRSVIAFSKDAADLVPALTALHKNEKDMFVRKSIKDALAAIRLAAVHLGQWYYIGPFDNTDRAGFKTEYPPEKGIDLNKHYIGKGGTKAIWREGLSFADGEINNLALFEDKDNTDAVIYLYREIEVAKPMLMDVSLGSDDTLTVWLNGEKLLAEEVYRIAAPDQNKLTLKLKEGKNRLLMKICQADGDWAFYFEVEEVK